MASVQFGGGIVSAIGSHGGTTFSRNKGGAYMKKKPYPIKSFTTTQNNLQSIMAYASKYWSNTLSDAQRAAWATYAAANPVTNRLGNIIFLSGQGMFCKLSCNLLGDGASIIVTPPVTNAVGNVTSLVISAVSGAPGTLHINPTLSGATIHDRVVLFVSGPWNAGRTYPLTHVQRLGSSWPSGVNSNLLANYEGVYGLTPQAGGQRIFCVAYGINESTGVMSGGFNNTTLWS